MPLTIVTYYVRKMMMMMGWPERPSTVSGNTDTPTGDLPGLGEEHPAEKETSSSNDPPAEREELVDLQAEDHQIPQIGIAATTTTTITPLQVGLEKW